MLAVFITLVISVSASALNSTVAYADVSSFLFVNRLVQCFDKPVQPRMPLSYHVPPDYFPSIPEDQRIPPNSQKQPQYVGFCEKVVQTDALNAYEFQTETLLSAGGLNIYDGAVWQIAMAVLGQVNQAVNVQSEIINKGATCTFSSVRGDAPCKGTIVEGECSDPYGACGFCYGKGSFEERSLAKPYAWSFRMITEYWSFAGTVDARCPEKNSPWTWNDYRPVLGENSWAFLIAPLQVAYFKFNGEINSIPLNDLSLSMAINFIPSLVKMTTPIGAVAYAPMNTLNGARDMGYEISTENNISLLAGLKMLRYILSKTGFHLDKLGDINTLIDNVQNYIKLSYEPSLGYFRQGGYYDTWGTFHWASGDSIFSVDCQTWAMSVLSPLLIDQWFGAGAAVKVWQTTKSLGGYNCDSSFNLCDGVGFSYNSEDQVFSGEWTLGAINMLRIFANEYNNPQFSAEAEHMRQAIENQLVYSTVIDNIAVTGIKYANKRYYIPFGWWANPLLSTASTAWTVLEDNDINPFYWGGEYRINYP